MTAGDDAIGIIAQTIGGSGGYADGAFTGEAGTGTAGSIAFDLTGSVQTAGDGSDGVLLQSIGGGDAGDIDYIQSGDVVTGGDDAIGIIVQTLGGGGGFADDAIRQCRRHRRCRVDRVRSDRLDLIPWATARTARCCRASAATAGDIDYIQAGNVITQGDGSIGIIAQSISGIGGYADGDVHRQRRHGHCWRADVDLTGVDPHPRRWRARRVAATHWRRRRRRRSITRRPAM